MHFCKNVLFLIKKMWARISFPDSSWLCGVTGLLLVNKIFKDWCLLWFPWNIRWRWRVAQSFLFTLEQWLKTVHVVEAPSTIFIVWSQIDFAIFLCVCVTQLSLHDCNKYCTENNNVVGWVGKYDLVTVQSKREKEKYTAMSYIKCCLLGLVGNLAFVIFRTAFGCLGGMKGDTARKCFWKFV